MLKVQSSLSQDHLKHFKKSNKTERGEGVAEEEDEDEREIQRI